MKTYIYCLLVLIITLLFVACDRTTEIDKQLVLSVLPGSGAYPDSTEIAISCNITGAEIYYTTNGTDPDQSSQIYISPILVGDIVNTELNFVSFKAKAFKEDYTSSITISREYSFFYESTVATPIVSRDTATNPLGATFTISCATPGAMIRYTLNGTVPNTLSAIYEHPITVNTYGVLVVNARAFKRGCVPSAITGDSYYINHPVQDMALIEGGDIVTDSLHIRLNSYYMDKREVSQTDFNNVMASDPEILLPNKGDYPVYYVSWFDAIAYCNKRSLLEHLNPCYKYNNSEMEDPLYWPAGWNTNDANSANISCNWDAGGYRLPTEMEWMYAAGGGTLGHNYQYSGSDSIYTVAWYAENSGYAVHQVATKKYNELGIYDLSGNLSEWCWDFMAPYPSGLQINPHGASTGLQRVIRGGSWYSPAQMCRVAARSSGLPTQNQAVSIGFRCVKKIPDEAK